MAHVAANAQVYADIIDEEMKDSHEKNLKELIGQFVSQSGKQHLMDKQMLFDRWPEYVGPMCAQFSKCEDLRNGILYVRVQNAALKFELFGHKSQILKKIEADFGPMVRDIMFKS
jgi:predicted nucleic acid-binding Zn ribbon protein